MPRLLTIVAILLFAVDAWAAGLNKSNSLTIENDSVTSNWTATCEISVSGIEPNQINSRVMVFTAFNSSGGAAEIDFTALIQVDPANRTWTESVPGIYSVKAKLKGHDVTVRAVANLSTVIVGDVVRCDSRIDQGTIGSETTLFGSNMRNDVALP